MSFESLKSEVLALPADARRKLIAFLVTLEDAGVEGYAAKLAAKIDDQSSDHWLSVEQCEQKLGLPGESR